MVLASHFLHVMLKKKKRKEMQQIKTDNLPQPGTDHYFLGLHDPAFNSDILTTKFDKSSNITNESDVSSFENRVAAHLPFI